MARTVAPGTPTPIQTQTVNTPEIDLSVFDKLGDKKIKAATQNFQLYATTTANAEAQKLYNQYDKNPIALANALSKLPEMFSDLPESVQTELKSKLDSNALSLVTKAKANQEKEIIKQNKRLAHANAMLGEQQISEDFFNVLSNMTAPDEEKNPVFDRIYQSRRMQLAQLTGMTDENGNPLFNETDRAKMIMPKTATVSGFQNFINRMEQKQLKEWDEKFFQNKDKFMETTGIDADTYETMETKLTSRLRALKNNDVRTVHGQAYYDATNLITEPTKLNIEKAKGYDFADKNAIDRLVKASKETTQAVYYDPKRKTSPNAFVQAYNQLGSIIQSIGDDPSAEEQAQIIAAAAEANERLVAVAKASNLSPEYTDRIKASIQKAMTDKLSRQTLVDVDFANRTHTYSALDTWKAGEPLNRQYQVERKESAESNLYKTAEEQALELATKRYNNDLSNAMLVYLSGDMQAFRQACADADRRFDMNRAGFIVKNDLEWRRLQNALANKQPALIQYMGRTLEFKGFDNKGAVFVEKH